MKETKGIIFKCAVCDGPLKVTVCYYVSGKKQIRHQTGKCSKCILIMNFVTEADKDEIPIEK